MRNRVFGGQAANEGFYRGRVRTLLHSTKQRIESDRGRIRTLLHSTKQRIESSIKMVKKMVPSMIRDIKLNCFDGKDENWRSWSAKFLARAHVLGYKEFIEGKLDDKEDPEVYSELNAYAFSDMIINCDGVAFSLVEMSKSGCYPEGDARVAWRQLKERYEAETYATKVQLKREYTRCKLPKGKDPDIWLMELEYMKQRLGKLGSEVEEEDLIAHILSNLGKDYEQLVNVVEGELEGLTFAKLRERIRSFYSRVLRHKTKDDENNYALWHQTKSKEKKNTHMHKFKGRCNRCGKYGHKAVQCAEKEQASRKVCHHCKKPGHIKKYCYKLNKVKNDRGFEGKGEYALITNPLMNYSTADEVWYADSGATKHMTNDSTNLYDVISMDEEIVVGNNERMVCKTKGKLRVTVKMNKCKNIRILLKEVLYVPKLKSNLFSLSELTKWKEIRVILDGDNVKINGPTWGSLKMFRRSMGETPYRMRCRRVPTNTEYISKLEKSIDINVFHQRIGHPSEVYTKKMAERYKISLKGKMDVCEACTYGEGKQKPIKKYVKSRTNVPLERIYVDTSELPYRSIGGSKFWIMVVDDATRYKWGYFVKSKDSLGETINGFIDSYKHEYNIKFVRCDNAGENQVLKKICEERGIRLEWTAPNTPQ